jgi:hypothetical protein
LEDSASEEDMERLKTAVWVIDVYNKVAFLMTCFTVAK